MINKKLQLFGILLFFLNIIFAQQANKKSDRLIRKGTIINAEGTTDIITKQEQYDDQTAQMLQFHKEADLAKQAIKIDTNKNQSFKKRNYIDISRKNQKGIIDSDASGANFIFEQNEIANKREEELAQFHKEAELAKQAREIEFKRKQMELLVAKQKAEELRKQKEEEEKQVALQKKETIFYLCIIICLVFFSVLSFIYFKRNLK